MYKSVYDIMQKSKNGVASISLKSHIKYYFKIYFSMIADLYVTFNLA